MADKIGALWYPKTQSEKAPFANGSIKLNGEEVPGIELQRGEALVIRCFNPRARVGRDYMHFNYMHYIKIIQ